MENNKNEKNNKIEENHEDPTLVEKILKTNYISNNTINSDNNNKDSRQESLGDKNESDDISKSKDKLLIEWKYSIKSINNENYDIKKVKFFSNRDNSRLLNKFIIKPKIKNISNSANYFNNNISKNEDDDKNKENKSINISEKIKKNKKVIKECIKENKDEKELEKEIEKEKEEVNNKNIEFKINIKNSENGETTNNNIDRYENKEDNNSINSIIINKDNNINNDENNIITNKDNNINNEENNNNINKDNNVDNEENNNIINKDNNIDNEENSNIINKDNNIDNDENNNILNKDNNIDNDENNNINTDDINVTENKDNIFTKIKNLNLSNLEKENFSNELTEKIINNILSSEIKDKKLLVTRKNTDNFSYNNISPLISQNSLSFGSHSPGHSPSKNNKSNNCISNSDNYSMQSIVSESVLNKSIFMKTIDEINEENELILYNKLIAPRLIKLIEKNIDENYSEIIKNLKTPYKMDEEKLVKGILFNEPRYTSMSKIHFENEKQIKHEFLDRKKILNEFKNINKIIRNKNNLSDDIIYDEYINKCILDTANEIIEKYRIYGKCGEPLMWSIRSRNIDFKFNDNQYSKMVFKKLVIDELKNMTKFRMGLIADNYDCIEMEHFNKDRDTKFLISIKKDLKENEDFYQIFETQETFFKIKLSKLIMEQLLNETVEILGHIQNSRKFPSKYQSNSIYACEDIPRLSFQMASDINYDLNEDDDNINQ